MKPFLILALAALAHARPEAGYAYNAPAPQPSSSYGTPSGGSLGGLGLSGLGGGFSGGHGGSGFSGGHGGGSGHGGGGFGSSGLGFSGLSGGFGGSGASFGGAQSFSGGSSSSSFGGGSFGGGSFGGAQQSFSSGGSSFGGGYQNQAPLISKHVYVHVAPEEPEFIRPARINSASQARKHYKIVFIKAPTAPTPTSAQVQLPQQDEEKTIIYVLSKKQEEQGEINVQAAAPTTPTKPEVYFIKYNTKKDQGGSGLSLSAGAGAAPSSGYGVPSSISANAAAPSYAGPSSLSAGAVAPSSSYGVPSGHGGY